MSEESARNPILDELYSSLRDRQLRMNLGSMYGRGPARAEAILAQHEAILDALGPDAAREAQARLVEHLGSTRTAVQSLFGETSATVMSRVTRPGPPQLA